MKSFIASTIFALLTTSTLASPASRREVAASPPLATVSLSNDQSGANGNAAVPLDGVARTVSQIYAGTNVISGGKVLVSSTSLNGGLASNPTCVFAKADGTPVTTLTSTHTFQKLGSDPNMLQIVDWTTFTLACSA